ncbi:hypothetical protein M3Y95_00640000 [Aphelenchoides besseyi]|nr:hypothetical protein M3Y95_00640000 [Aphelenchoides besseyi]
MSFQCMEEHSSDMEEVIAGETIVLILHRVLNTLICFVALVLNLFLMGIIVHCKTDLKRMKPLIGLNCLCDILAALINLIACRFIYAGHGVFIRFLNTGFHSTNRLYSEIVLALVVSINLICWSISPIQFLYRYHIVKYGDRPRGLRGLLYALFGLCFIASNLYASRSWTRIGTTIDVTSSNITVHFLKHFGYQLDPREVFFESNSDLNFKFSSYIYFMNLLLGLSLIVFLLFKIRKFLNKRVASKATQKLNKTMDNILFVWGAVPLLTSLIPGFYISYALGSCVCHEYLNLICALAFSMVPLLNAIVSLTYIRPYKLMTVRIIDQVVRFLRRQPTQPTSVCPTIEQSAVSRRSRTQKDGTT